MKKRHHVIYLAVMAVVLGWQATALAQTSRKQPPPPPQPLRPLRFPAFEQRTLPNGLRVVVIEHHEQPALSLRLVLKAGAIYDPADKPGLAQATAALLDQGTKTRSAQDIAQAIDFVGGSLGAGADWDAAYASASVTSDHLDLGTELLADIVLNPTFKEEEIDRWRTQALSGLQVQMQDPKFLAAAAFNRLVFGAHPYGQPMEGTPESVRTITRDDMVRFHHTHYRPNVSIIAVVGDVKPAEAFATIERHFGRWEKGAEVPLPAFNVPLREARHILVLDKPDAVQTEIRVGHVGIARTDPDYFTAQVFNTILGGSSQGRLYVEIRSKRGLTYGAYSEWAERLQPGYFWATTYTKTESTVDTVELIVAELRRMQTELVSTCELDARKAYLTGSFPLRIETPDDIAAQVLEAMLYGYDRSYLETYRDHINGVTAEQVKAFANAKIHPDRVVIVLVGNAGAFEAELKRKFQDYEKIAYHEIDLMQPDLKRKQEDVAAKPASEAERAEAMTILRKTIEALGGEAYLQQKSQIARGSGTMTPPGLPQAIPVPSIVAYEVLPDKSRLEVNTALGPMIQAFNGQIGWMSIMGQVRDTTEQSKLSRYYGVNVLRRYDQAGYSVRLLPEAQVEGKKAKVVAISDAEGHTTKFFIDPQTHLILKTAAEAMGQQLEEVYSDYKSVNGIQVPHRRVLMHNGAKLIEFVVSEIQINPDIDPALFDKP